MIKRDFVDAYGFRRRSLIPDDTADPNEGIPCSLALEVLYAHMPITFQLALNQAFWDVGLIEPGDFLRAGATEKIRAAWLSVVKHDVFAIQGFAKEQK